jgi:NIPSNAP
MISSFKSTLTALIAVAACIIVPHASFADSAKSEGRVFEIRTYTTPEGKLDELHKRFREHTMKIFERHGMTNIGYWTPQDPPLAGRTLIYVISHKSREDAKKNWAEFGADPEWKKVKSASEANGPIVTKVESVFVDATDYSPMK